MIQELLGSGIGVGSISGSAGQDEQKKVNVVMSNIGAGLTTIDQASSNSSSSSSSEQHPNLRCPRCDSSNTKFCYYNNYNLTQPRHFCKSCRRYWTKGGALRNVPIGGGCRKSKTQVMSSVAGKSTSGKARPPIFTSDVSKVNMVSGVIDHHHEQIAPHNSQLMALLRAADQGPSYNPNHILNSVVVKDQVAGMLESNLFSDHASLATGVMCSRTSPLMGLCSSLWRSNSDHDQQQQLILPQLSLQQNFLLGQVSNINGFQDLHIQRFRSSPSINYDHARSTQSSSMVINNPASDSSLASSTNEAAAMAVGELGNWNYTLQWTDLSNSNDSIP